VVKIDFFRAAARVSRLLQTLIVRDDLTTDSWDGESSNLTWNVFASSYAKLGGISIVPLGDFSSATYSYAVSVSTVPSPSVPLTVTPGTPGQAIAVKLNGTPVAPDGSGVFNLSMTAANSIDITVTAPDGVTQQTYAVTYTYRHGTDWYVSEQGGNDGTGTGTSASPFASVAKALAAISAAYGGSSWTNVSGKPAAARINISGTITTTGSGTYTGSDGMIQVGSGLPPIILAGAAGAQIDAGNSRRVLYISNGGKVILEDGLTLTRGSGGVSVNGSGSTFTMNGGAISGNKAIGSSGGGVSVNGSGSTFTMNGGAISGNEATGSGGGVVVSGSSSTTFIMTKGTISGNCAANGGGVYVVGGTFIMTGGTISGNEATDKSSIDNGGGGVSAVSFGRFTMTGGTINDNHAARGGGVFIYSSSDFIMSGGTISGNNDSDYGGGVYVGGPYLDDAWYRGRFTMSGGTINGNTASGVYVESGTFAMKG
jgi:hypothetical protein